jgi:hypothetical protein
MNRSARLKAHLKHLLDFRSYFQTESTVPIEFSSRPPPNLVHDLYYLSSYIHDAEFGIGQVCLQGKKLRILMKRCRWERYDAVGNLETIPSQLTIQPVDSITWELKGPHLNTGNLSQATKFIVSRLYMGESYWDEAPSIGVGELILSGHLHSKLHIVVADLFGFRLKDLPGKKATDDGWIQ